MLSLLTLALCLAPQQQESLPLPSHIQAGWRDELDDPGSWALIAAENQASRRSLKKGEMFLALGHVPADWPYAYQWSGVTRDSRNDIGRFPVLMARATVVKGYAHLDVEVRDDQGKTIKTLRSSTLTAPGIALLDIGKELGAGNHTFRIRMIVGGPNAGCAVAYDWIRFVRREDVDFLIRHPNYKQVRGHQE